MKLSNNSLANHYFLYCEGEQTDYDVCQVHMNQNVSDWNSNETIANNESSQANETNAKDNINNLTLIHYNPNEIFVLWYIPSLNVTKDPLTQ